MIVSQNSISFDIDIEDNLIFRLLFLIIAYPFI